MSSSNLLAHDAIVLALPTRGAAPSDRLAGLSLALRCVLTLQKEGIARVALVVRDALDAQEVTADRRVHVSVDTVLASTPEEGLLAAARSLESPMLVAEHDVVADPLIYRRLREVGADLTSAHGAVFAARGQDVLGPFVARREFIEQACAEGAPTFDIVDPLSDGRARTEEMGASFAHHVTTEAGHQAAFDALFEACRKPVDGIVARNINRHISIAFSKRLVDTPLTPNQMSLFTFTLGIAAAVSASRGGYLSILIGAFLLQWNSILDGVDGELARVRFQHSKLGQWLDTVSDDASNMLFYAGLALGSREIPVVGPWLALCGFVAVGASLLATAQMYAELIRVGSGDLYAIEWDFDKAAPATALGKFLLFFRYAVKKDFALLFFLGMAVLGVLPYALPVIAGGAIGTLIATTMRNIKKLRAAPQRFGT